MQSPTALLESFLRGEIMSEDNPSLFKRSNVDLKNTKIFKMLLSLWTGIVMSVFSSNKLASS